MKVKLLVAQLCLTVCDPLDGSPLGSSVHGILQAPWVVLGFSEGMEAFDELLSINVPWSQEISDVLRIWT